MLLGIFFSSRKYILVLFVVTAMKRKEDVFQNKDAYCPVPPRSKRVAQKADHSTPTHRINHAEKHR